jgi:hypothetical protein
MERILTGPTGVWRAVETSLGRPGDALVSMASPVTEVMKRTLKDRVVPVLRARGFTGSFPTLTRRRAETTDRINFQFSQWGGGFYVNVNDLLRLGAQAPNRDHLFALPDTLTPDLDAVCLQRAEEIIALLDQQAERWWREGPREFPEFVRLAT